MNDFLVLDPRFHEAIAEDAQMERLTDGLLFGEGPIWHPQEQFLIFSDIIAAIQYRWSPSDGQSVFRRPSNMANGNFLDREGRVLSCEHGTSRVVRHDHEGRVVTTLASHFEGKALNSPNDIVCDARGRIWFTDPSFGRIREDVGILRDCELDFQGVYRIDPDGTLTCVVRDFQQPNGLCLSLDESRLYVNDSADPSIRVFDIAEDGSLTHDMLFARVEGEQPGGGRKWVPDGMKLSHHGFLFCNGPGGVHIFDEAGKDLGTIRFPEKSTNFCFGGADRTDLFITTANCLYRLPTKTSGPPMIPGFDGT